MSTSRSWNTGSARPWPLTPIPGRKRSCTVTRPGTCCAGSAVGSAAGNGSLGSGGVHAAEPTAEPAQHVPGRVTVQDLFLPGIGVSGHGRAVHRSSCARCSSRAGSAPVATSTLRRCVRVLLAGSSSRTAWVSGRCPAASSASSARTWGRRSQPSAFSGRRCRPGPAGRPAGRGDPPGHRVGQKLAELLVQVAAAARTGHQPLAGAAGRAGLPLGARGGAAAAQRLLACPGAQTAGPPAPRARHPRLGARPAPRLAGDLGEHAGPGLPADRAGHDGPRDAGGADWPACRARADGPATAAAGAPLQVGRVGAQAVRANWLALLVAGRRLAHRSAPAARPARARAQQPRQTRSPSTSLLSATTRPHRGQGGRAIRVAPASQSASISLSTMGNGASAPPPVSSAGDSCSAHASFRRCAGLTTVASSAAVTASPVRSGSAVVMTSVSTSRGSRASWSGHWPQRGRPCRSREATCRTLPHEAQASGGRNMASSTSGYSASASR